MVIRKDDNSIRGKAIFCLALVRVMVAVVESVSHTGNRAAEALIATYGSAPVLTTTEAESAIARLEKALVDCEDSCLTFRIKYRIGVICFKADMMDASKDRFLSLVNDPECPELIHICGLNMIGQISRLAGRNSQALGAFERLANLLEKRLSIGGGYAANPALPKLLCLTLFAKGEISELSRDYAAAIAEYDRVLRILSENKNEFFVCRYAPLANDRICRLYLQQADVNSYRRRAEALIADYPEYYRTPVVKLEVACVKFLQSASADVEFADGGFSAPAEVIAWLKSSSHKTLGEQIVNTFETLCRGYEPSSYGGVLLYYHYAWLLDTLGKKDRALDLLARICSRDIGDISSGFLPKSSEETVQDYAKIQRAVMLGERADYEEALQVLDRLRAHPDKSHISELGKSVREGIEILRREVRPYESQ